MYVLKFALTDTNEDLAVELKKQLSNDCDINIEIGRASCRERV